MRLVVGAPVGVRIGVGRSVTVDMVVVMSSAAPASLSVAMSAALVGVTDMDVAFCGCSAAVVAAVMAVGLVLRMSVAVDPGLASAFLGPVPAAVLVVPAVPVLAAVAVVVAVTAIVRGPNREWKA